MGTPYQYTESRPGTYNTADPQMYSTFVPSSQAGQYYLQYNNFMMYPQRYPVLPPTQYNQISATPIPQSTQDTFMLPQTHFQSPDVLPPKSKREKCPLDIFDPETKEKLDLAKLTPSRTTEDPVVKHQSFIPQSKSLNVHTPLIISKPEPKHIIIEEPKRVQKELHTLEVECDQQPILNQIGEREKQVPEESSVTEDQIGEEEAVEEIEWQDGNPEENETNQIIEENKQNTEEEDGEVEEEEEEEQRDEEKEVDSKDEYESDKQSAPSSENADESDLGQRVRRYDRDELMKLRITTDTSAMQLSIPSNIRKGHVKQTNKRRTMFLKTDLKLDSVANPYVVKKAEDRSSSLYKEFNTIFNRVLDENIRDAIDDLKKLNLSGKEEVSCLVDVLTTKATRQTKYSGVFAKLCVALANTNQFEGFKTCLLVAVNKLFETPLQTHIAQTNAQIDAKIAESNDEKVKKMLEEDRETAITKKREAFLGIMQFFSHLYINKMIPDKSAQESLKPFAKPKTQDEILAILTCLNTCGPMLEDKIPHVLRDCIAGLENAKKDVKMEQHVLYKITALIELRARHWKKLEPVVPPPQILPRPEQRRETVTRRMQPHTASRKTGDSQTLINPKSLTLSGQRSGQQGKFLGPVFDWSKGSHSNPSTLRQSQTKFTNFTEVTSESESGKESRPSSTSARKQNSMVKKALKIDDNLTVDGAITDAFDAFRLSDTPTFDLLLRENDKNKFVSVILSDNVEKAQHVRKTTTDILYHLYKKEQLSSDQMYYGFSELLKQCDEDFLVDCPKGDEYIGEFLSAIATDVSTVTKILKELPETRLCTVLTSCLSTASARSGEDFARVYSTTIDLSNLQNFNFKESSKKKVFKNSVSKAPKPKKEYTEADKLDLAISKRNFDEVRSICESSKSKSKEFITQIVSSLPDASRKDIDGLVSIIKKLADTDKDLLETLEKATEKDVFKMWILSLVQHKQISRESIHDYADNLLSKSGHKEVANQILSKNVR